MWIRTAILRPRLTYEVVCWRGSSVYCELSTGSIRGLILIGVTGDSKLTPTPALWALIGLEYLHLNIKAVAGNASGRLNLLNDRRILIAIQIPVDIAMRPTLDMFSDKMPTRYLCDKRYRVSLSTKEEWVNDNTHMPSDGDNWFTDGSRSKKKAGAVYIVEGMEWDSPSICGPTP